MDSDTNTTTAPADATPASAEPTPAPKDATPAPTDPSPAAAEAAPAPADPAPAAAEAMPAPADVTPAPSDAAAAPAEAAPAATNIKPRRPRQSPRARHRNEFYGKLTELRAEPTDDRGRSARVAAAVERVGGAEVVRDALAPKQRSDGTPMKWSAVCCDLAFGKDAADPAYSGWVRLAATPVREIKGAVGGSEQRSRRGPGRGDGPRRGSNWSSDDTSRQDIAQYGTDGSLRTRLHIPALP